MTSRLDQFPIIAFDGNHRTGKGTQIDIINAALRADGYTTTVLRGDGSRPGIGVEESDPLSEYWINFKQYAESVENPFEAWREGSRRLLGEAATTMQSLETSHVILFDRSTISRTQMTLKEGLDPTFWNLYNNLGLEGLTDEDIIHLRPDLLLYLTAEPSVMLDRLDQSDPKYAFRRDNIIKSNRYFDSAYDICENNTGGLERIDAGLSMSYTADRVRHAIIKNQTLREKGVTLRD